MFFCFFGWTTVNILHLGYSSYNLVLLIIWQKMYLFCVCMRVCVCTIFCHCMIKVSKWSFCFSCWELILLVLKDLSLVVRDDYILLGLFYYDESSFAKTLLYCQLSIWERISSCCGSILHSMTLLLWFCCRWTRRCRSRRSRLHAGRAKPTQEEGWTWITEERKWVSM